MTFRSSTSSRMKRASLRGTDKCSLNPLRNTRWTGILCLLFHYLLSGGHEDHVLWAHTDAHRLWEKASSRDLWCNQNCWQNRGLPRTYKQTTEVRTISGFSSWIGYVSDTWISVSSRILKVSAKVIRVFKTCLEETLSTSARSLSSWNRATQASRPTTPTSRAVSPALSRSSAALKRSTRLCSKTSWSFRWPTLPWLRGLNN